MIQWQTFLKITILLVVVISIPSCTVLQWRSTDLEIKEKFKNRNIETALSYYSIDSLNLDVRVQQVPNDSSTINVVFFHGSPSSLSAWDGYLLDSTLNSKANLYAIDRPGYGYSDFGTAMVSIKKQAQIMSALIEDYNLSNVIVVGSSYGGPLAARIGYLNQNVKAIVMISPAIDPDNEKDIWASRFTRWKLTRWMVPTGYRVAGDEKQTHSRELQRIAEDWSQVSIPVYHFHGTTDDIVPYENVEFSQGQFSNVEIITFENKGHEIAWKNPELIIPYLLDIINQMEKDK